MTEADKITILNELSKESLIKIILDLWENKYPLYPQWWVGDRCVSYPKITTDDNGSDIKFPWDVNKVWCSTTAKDSTSIS